MTAEEEAIKYIQDADNMGIPLGFFVTAISKEDLQSKLDRKQLSELEEANELGSFLSDVADSMQTIYENDHFDNDLDDDLYNRDML